MFHVLRGRMHILQRSTNVKSIWCVVLLKSSASLLVVCLDDLSIDRWDVEVPSSYCCGVSTSL